MYTLHEIPPGPGSGPPGVTAKGTVHNPANNVWAPAIHPEGSAGSPSAAVSVSHPFDPAPGGKAASSPDSEARASSSPGSMTFDLTPCTCLDSEPTEETLNDDPVNPVTSPSSQSSVPWSRTRLASAEIEKPLCKPSVKTPPGSPLRPSPIPKRASTPPPTPDHAPLKATLVLIDTSSIDTPMTPITPKVASKGPSAEMDQLSTSLDETDQSELPAEASGDGSPTQDRRPSKNSADAQDVPEEGGAVNDGSLGNGEGDKSKEEEDEFEEEDEALLRALMRCNPYLLTFK